MRNGITLLRYGCLVGCLILALAATYHFMDTARKSGPQWDAALTLASEGYAYKPLVYRALMPLATGVIAKILPSSVKEWVDSHYSLPNSNAEPPYQSKAHRILIMVILIASCLLGYAYVLYWLARAVFPGREAAAMLAPILGLAGLFVPVFPAFRVEDASGLLLLAALLLALQRERWGWYLSLFVLSTINKETAIFILPVFMLAQWRKMPRQLFFSFVVLQIVLFLFVKIGLAILFRAAPIPEAFITFEQHWAYFIGSPHTIEVAIALSIMLVLCALRWRTLPSLVKQSMILFIPVSVSLFMAGQWGAYRMHYEICIVLALFVVHLLTASSLRHRNILA